MNSPAIARGHPQLPQSPKISSNGQKGPLRNGQTYTCKPMSKGQMQELDNILQQYQLEKARAEKADAEQAANMKVLEDLDTEGFKLKAEKERLLTEANELKKKNERLASRNVELLNIIEKNEKKGEAGKALISEAAVLREQANQTLKKLHQQEIEAQQGIKEAQEQQRAGEAKVQAALIKRQESLAIQKAAEAKIQEGIAQQEAAIAKEKAAIAKEKAGAEKVKAGAEKVKAGAELVKEGTEQVKAAIVKEKAAIARGEAAQAKMEEVREEEIKYLDEYKQKRKQIHSKLEGNIVSLKKKEAEINAISNEKTRSELNVVLSEILLKAEDLKTLALKSYPELPEEHQEYTKLSLELNEFSKSCINLCARVKKK